MNINYHIQASLSLCVPVSSSITVRYKIINCGIMTSTAADFDKAFGEKIQNFWLCICIYILVHSFLFLLSFYILFFFLFMWNVIHFAFCVCISAFSPTEGSVEFPHSLYRNPLHHANSNEMMSLSWYSKGAWAGR